MKHLIKLTIILFGLLGIQLQSCIWAKRCPQPSCRVAKEHRHEGQVFRPRAAFSWIYTKKHLPFTAKKKDEQDASKINRKAKQPQYRYLLPGESLGKPKN